MAKPCWDLEWFETKRDSWILLTRCFTPKRAEECKVYEMSYGLKEDDLRIVERTMGEKWFHNA